MLDEKVLSRVNVFIASPGDTADDRERVRKAVTRVNRLVAEPNGILLEAIGWEDIPAGKAQRPQDLINPYLDDANVFVGILNKRFGEPTGVAESGTEEEYIRISERWKSETPRPLVMVYFKRLSQEDVTDPGPQLQRVLDFQERISSTDLYRVFDTTEQLGETIEEALADWVYKNRESLKPSEGDLVLDPNDLEILATLVKLGEVTNDRLTAETGASVQCLREVTTKLDRQGLISMTTQGYKPANSTEGFVSLVKHLNTDRHYKVLLRSGYYNLMLRTCLSGLIHSRFHCDLQADIVDILRKLALLSPSSAAYLFFGDTELYDNLAQHSKKIGQEQFGNEIILNNILVHVLLKYGDDSLSGHLLDEIDGKPLAGQVFAIRLAAAYEEERAFEVRSVMPSMRLKAGEDLEKGQLVSGPPGLLVRIGIALMHMGELDLAIGEFNKVLSPEVSADVQCAALNNKGLILLHQGRPAEALNAFEEAVELDPTRPEPRENLELAKSSLQGEDVQPQDITRSGDKTIAPGC